MTIDRRLFLKSAALSAAAGLIPGGARSLAAQPAVAPGTAAGDRDNLIIDTNIHLFQWPFRHLKYGQTGALVTKLRKHRVQQAWAGSFEALFSKDIHGVNTRLVDECRRHGADLLVPIGSVNPVWPGWEEDLRRCHEVHRMRAIRLHPCYQGYTLEEPAFAQLLEQATARGLFVQIVLEMEDPRVHHPGVRAPSASPAPLVSLFQKIPAARVQLLGDSFSWMRIPQAKPLLQARNLSHDISAIEGVGGVGRLIGGNHWNIAGKIPLERILFGSHAPYYPLESALLKLFESPFTLPEMQSIMAINAGRLLPGA